MERKLGLIRGIAISRIENGTQKFSKSKLESLSKLFNLDIQNVTDLFFVTNLHEKLLNTNALNQFGVAEDTANYLRNTNIKQGKLKFENE